MTLKDYHIHSVYSDGKNTIEDIIQAAIAMGLTEIGISDHSYTSFDTHYCMQPCDIARYKDEIFSLKNKYKCQISILCGIEQDLFSDIAAEGYDYIIGSVHYIWAGGEYIPVDSNAEILKSATKKYFDNNFYALADAYYSQMDNLVEKTNATIIGHFDLITKFTEQCFLFDIKDERYRKSWKKACDCLLNFGIPFEINTGAISRGYRTTPYPNCEIIDYIKEKGGHFILNSDSHSKENLCYCFNEAEELIR